MMASEIGISVPLSCLMLNVLHPPDGVSAAGWLNALATQLAVHELGGLQNLQLPAASHWMKRSKSRMLLFCSLVVGMKRRQLKKLADPWQSLQTWTLPYQLVRVNLSALQPTRSSCTLRLFLSLSLCQVICHATISSLMWSFELLPVRMGRLFAAFWNGGFLWKGSPFQSQSFWVEGSKWRRVNLCLVPGNAAHLDLQMRAKVHGSMWRSTTPCAVQSFAFQARRSGMLFWTKLVPLHSSLLSILASPLTWDPTKRSWMTEPGRFSMHCSLHGKHQMAVAMVAVAMMHPSALPTYNCCLTQPLHLWWLPAGVVKQMLLTACFAARPLLVHKVGQAPAVMRWWLWGWLAWHALLTSQTSCCSPPFLSPAGFACDRRDVTSCHLGRPEQRFLFHQSPGGGRGWCQAPGPSFDPVPQWCSSSGGSCRDAMPPATKDLTWGHGQAKKSPNSWWGSWGASVCRGVQLAHQFKPWAKFKLRALMEPWNPLEQQHLFVELYSIRGICGKILLSVFGPQLDLPYVTMVPPICLKLSECPACCHSIKGKDIPTESSLVMTWECSRMSWSSR